MNTTLIIGFDSAWSGINCGAIVGVLREKDGTYRSLGDPLTVNFDEATKKIIEWQDECCPAITLILIDQPTIVEKTIGQRPVENIVSSPVSSRYGAVQPSNRSKIDMFGDGAPIWKFTARFGDPCDPTKLLGNHLPEVCVIETYPVLTLIAMNWILSNHRPSGRLPKYNPDRKTFSLDDWRYVCNKASDVFAQFGLPHLVKWIGAARDNPFPALRRERKQLQDCLDACICLFVGLRLISGADCMFVGNMSSGYMVVPYEGETLYQQLKERCEMTGRNPDEWILKNFRIC
jgi:predicted RNase H-like nuclease